MANVLLDFMLGPLRGISEFYFEHQLIFNTIVIGFAAYKLFFSKKKETQIDSAN
ncbi:hypothetical protein ACQKGD_09345 [Peribacillus frigoritolerans]|uniref:hypothetical protein n=1 Tax=Peribacillus frigoritolerans TaxID=450367 RepID=UPI00207A52ED|nr:hypothetical protein [Peribacillus frigoritolerans]USK68253.1 hypothetical protein LIT26_30045 [Peribacillus frigoritolerans]